MPYCERTDYYFFLKKNCSLYFYSLLLTFTKNLVGFAYVLWCNFRKDYFTVIKIIVSLVTNVSYLQVLKMRFQVNKFPLGNNVIVVFFSISFQFHLLEFSLTNYIAINIFFQLITFHVKLINILAYYELYMFLSF